VSRFHRTSRPLAHCKWCAHRTPLIPRLSHGVGPKESTMQHACTYPSPSMGLWDEWEDNPRSTRAGVPVLVVVDMQPQSPACRAATCAPTVRAVRNEIRRARKLGWWVILVELIGKESSHRSKWITETDPELVCELIGYDRWLAGRQGRKRRKRACAAGTG
jgi:hypothetical protein